MSQITVDAHIDVPWKMYKYGAFVLREGSSSSAVSFDKLKKGGLTAFFAALYLSDKTQDDLGPPKVKDAIDRQISLLKGQPGVTIVDSAMRAQKAVDACLVPIFMGLEGGRLIHSSIGRLRQLRAAGVKYITLTHNKGHGWADSATDTPQLNGLGKFGAEVMATCHNIGMIVDISHTSDATSWDVLDLTERPVIASHSGCKQINDHVRNLSNHIIRAIAATDGVVGIPFVQKFIGEGHKISDHIDHVVQMVGIDYVGIGSDLDGAVMVDGVENASHWQNAFVDDLLKKGYTDDDILKVAGGNFMRVME